MLKTTSFKAVQQPWSMPALILGGPGPRWLHLWLGGHVAKLTALASVGQPFPQVDSPGPRWTTFSPGGQPWPQVVLPV